MQQSFAQQPNFPVNSELYFLGILLVMCYFYLNLSSQFIRALVFHPVDLKQQRFIFVHPKYIPHWSGSGWEGVLFCWSLIQEIRLMEVLASAIVTDHRGRKQRGLNFDISSEAFSMFQCSVLYFILWFAILHHYHHLNREFINSCLEHCNDSLPYILLCYPWILL